MSRKSVLTVEILLRMPLPPGVKPQHALDFVKSAIAGEKQAMLNAKPQSPLAAIQPLQVVAKIVKRETTYL